VLAMMKQPPPAQRRAKLNTRDRASMEKLKNDRAAVRLWDETVTMTQRDDREISSSVAAHRAAIYRYILSIVRDPAAADDLTQDTLLRGHSKRATLEDPSKFVPWLYRIATNRCRDRFREASYRHPASSLDSEGGDSSESSMAGTVPDTGPRLDKVMEQKEMSACVQDYLAGLSDSYRAVILLHDAEGLTNPEIADMLGVSLATVKIRLHRAREKLGAVLAEACSFSTDERGVVVCEPRLLKIEEKPPSS
jgi:RNA polymerase sigma-70 factor (ECF subfamily)